MDWDTIIALDLGKFTTVACVMRTDTRESQFETVATVPQTLHDLRVKHGSAVASGTLVVLEACDAAGWVHDLAFGLGMKAAVANCNHDAWLWRKVKRKSDKDDAMKLARMALLGELPTVHMPEPKQRQKRRLLEHRRSLVRMRTQVKNQIRALFHQQGLTHTLAGRSKAWSRAGLEQLQEQAKRLCQCPIDQLWRGRLRGELQLLYLLQDQIDEVDAKLEELAQDDERVKRLTTVPGVGLRLAETVVTCLDDVSRFKTAAQVGSYAGLVPKQMESGTMRRMGHITRRGPSLLRAMLVEVAWAVWRYNDWAKALVQRVSRGMKQRRKIAIVALARKLLIKLWAMLRDGTEWQTPPVPAAATPALG